MQIRPMIPKITGYILRRTTLLLLCVLIMGLLYTYATRNMSFNNLSVGKLINLDNIESVQVANGIDTSKSPLFQATDKKGKVVVKKVVAWINSAKMVEGATDRPITHGFQTSTLLIYDSLGEKGQYVMIQPAYKMETDEIGKGVSTAPAKNELVISQGVDRFRIYSPELFNWFEGGWTRDK